MEVLWISINYTFFLFDVKSNVNKIYATHRSYIFLPMLNNSSYARPQPFFFPPFPLAPPLFSSLKFVLFLFLFFFFHRSFTIPLLRNDFYALHRSHLLLCCCCMKIRPWMKTKNPTVNFCLEILKYFC